MIDNTKLLISTALVSFIISSATHAQTTNFVGPSVALSGSYIGGSSEFKTGTTFRAEANQEVNSKLGDQTNVIPGADLNYGFAMGNNFVLGLGATYDFNKTTTGALTVNSTEGEGEFTRDVARSIDSSLKDHYSLYIQPTYVINKDSAMFAKVGRHYAKSSVKSSVIGNGENPIGFLGSDVTVSKKIEGWGFGLGLKAFLTSNLFVQLEGGIVEYDKINLPFKINGLDEPTLEDNTGSHKTKTTNATVSVGYKF